MQHKSIKKMINFTSNNFVLCCHLPIAGLESSLSMNCQVMYMRSNYSRYYTPKQ